jgi:predicted ATPase/DNA-binding winged helix-turn-helix (wHTH) protein
MNAVELSGSRSAVAFGPFRLLPGRGVLLKGDIECRLGSRALDILVCLVERAGATVTKRDLISRAWPDTFVHEANLRVHVAALRKALGDGRAGMRYIVNVMGRGYCFVAPVTPIDQPQLGAPRAARQTNLPAPLSQIIGREATAAAIALQIPARRCVTIAGPGGIGKTAVAIMAAERLIDAYDDGVWFVDLSALADHSPVAPAVAAVLALSTSAINPLLAIVALLRDRRMLLVLDNCEHVIKAVAEMAEAMLRGAPGVAVLTTSREPLRATTEWVHWLAPMSVPPQSEGLTAAQALTFPAVELFVQCASASLEGFDLTDADAPVVATICRGLDGLPLAIELAAARVDLFGIRGLMTVLDDPFLLLAEGRRTAMPRQRSLLQTLQWSYRLLSPIEQRVLHRLAVFRGQFTLDGALAVAAGDGLTVEEVYSGVLTLSAKSLLVTDVSGTSPQAQHRLLHIVRSFIIQKQSGADVGEKLPRRHASYIRTLLETAQTDWTRLERNEWLAIYGRTIDDVRGAIDWAFSSRGDLSLGVLLTALAVPLGFQLSLVHEFRALVERALMHTGPLVPPQPIAEMRLNIVLSNLVHNSSGPVNARTATMKRAFDIASELPDEIYRVEPLIGWATAQQGVGDYDSGHELATKALEIGQTANNPEATLAAERLLAQLKHFQGDHAAARILAERVIGHPAAQLPLPYNLMPVNRHVAMRVILARISWLEGAWARADELIEEMLRYAKRDAAYALCPALVFAAIPISIWNGKDLEARAFTRQLSEQAARYTLGYWQDWAEAFSAVLDGRAGCSEAVTAISDRFLSAPVQQEALTTLAETLITPALAMRADSGAAGWCRAEICRAQGAWMFAQRTPSAVDRAEEMFRGALAVAGSQNAASWSLRAGISLAHLLRDTDRAPEARSVLVASVENLDATYPSADLARGLKLLREFEGHSVPSAVPRPVSGRPVRTSVTYRRAR